MKTNFSSRSSTTTPKAVRPEEVVGKTEAGILQLDADRAKGYAGLITLRSAKDTALDRRAKLYTAKYGADHPRVALSHQQRQTNAQLQQELAVAHTNASTPVPEVDDHSYVLHGFVRDSDRRPIADLTVALYDQNGQCLCAAEYTPTDETGHFEVRYTSPAVDEKARSNASSGKTAAEEKARAAQEKTPAATGRDQTKGVYEIRVYDAKETLLYRDPTPVKLRAGAVDYREITLDGEKRSTVTPPGCDDETPPRKKMAKAHPAPVKKMEIKAAKPAAASSRDIARSKKKRKK